jgi:hypothetical protein
MLELCSVCGQQVRAAYQLTFPLRCEDCQADEWERLNIKRGVQTIAQMLGAPMKTPPELLEAA